LEEHNQMNVKTVGSVTLKCLLVLTFTPFHVVQDHITKHHQVTLQPLHVHNVKLVNTARQSDSLDRQDAKLDTIVRQDQTTLLQIAHAPSAWATSAKKDIPVRLVSRSKNAKMELSVHLLEQAHASLVQRVSHAKITSILLNVMTTATVNAADLLSSAVLENSMKTIEEHLEMRVKNAFLDITAQVAILTSRRSRAPLEQAASGLKPKCLVNQENIARQNLHCLFYVHLERNVLIQQLQPIAKTENTVPRRAPSLIVPKVISAILIKCSPNLVRWELTTISSSNLMKPLPVRTAATVATALELELVRAPRVSVMMGTTALIANQISLPRPLSVLQEAFAVILAKQNYAKTKLTLRKKDQANVLTVQMDFCAIPVHRSFLLLVRKVVSVKMVKKINAVVRLLGITEIYSMVFLKRIALLAQKVTSVMQLEFLIL